MKYLFVLIGGFLLFLLFKGLRLLIRKISSDKRYFKDFWTALTIAEFICWIVYVFWSFDRMLGTKSYYQYILMAEIVIIVLLLGYYFINDLVAGAIFRIQHHPQKGKYYDFKKYSGKILKVGSTSLLLETSDGQELEVPFSEIKGPVFVRKELKAQSNIILKLKVPKTKPKDVILANIHNAVLTSAYTSFKDDPVIKMVNEDDEFLFFEILINTLNSKHQALIEKEIYQVLEA